MSDIQITILEGDSVSYELVVSERFLLLKKDCVVNIKLPASLHNWDLRLHFITDKNKDKGTGLLEFEPTIIHYKLFNWDSSTGVENKGPTIIEAKDKKTRAFLKLKTESHLDKEYRGVTLSIWKEIVK